MERKNLLLVGVSALIVVVIGCSSKEPATPVAPTSPSSSAPDGSTLKATPPSPQSPINDQQLTTAQVMLVTGASTAQFADGVPLQYRFQVFNAANVLVQDSGVVGGTSWPVTATLQGRQRYMWRTRAEYQGAFGPWSPVVSFIAAETALVFDPLTNGTTVGQQRGGFFTGQGWQSGARDSGIDYDIPTCSSCTVEFDITNIGKGEGVCCNADLIFLSMADAGSFAGFGPFRDTPWKMHLKQRADGDGTGFDIVWRNGGVGGGNPGDHRIKVPGGGPDYRSSSVFHFVVQWSEAGYNISVGTDGGPQVQYMADGFGGIPYSPPNHRVSLGCYPRGESFPSAIYRNVKISKNQ
ncbi:MAG: hypothetical protein C5B57_13145 [Blastocatellia bacterium]|nr:MAG: hypothetical protein C5B57_13145 [Blastocatellia bacterium]